MAKLTEIYGYGNPAFQPLKDPARGVIEAYQNAARFLDTVQERVYIRMGLVHTARMIHDLAHEMPKRFDVFSDMLHERHLEAIYPATPELTEEIPDMDRAFEIVTGVLEDIQAALERFHAVTDNAAFRPMALKTEELMLRNSEDYTRFLEAWAMWDNLGGASSFDNWVLHLKEE